ncbi:hypothetical protein FB561_1337 [Kribbella amoyensis]|uniref:DUF1648 domain-containing protein n=1 Tax=Kribbella amoyensis TaxID=996641 RepID=A0A561BN45_9ACTN|nr:hypothetical protein [Kribbella amoyensis]TWD80264.1 hypothetical protein FB561_1337 [Kribbella amoyensis]
MTATGSTEVFGTENAPPPWVLVPWPGAMVAVAAVGIMVVASIAAWPEMAVEVVTREAGGRHGESVANRGVTAAAMPAVLLGLTVLLSVVLRADHELLKRTPVGLDRSPERARRMFSWTLMGLSVVLVALHLGLLSLHTGTAFPLEQAVAAAVGILLACLGVATPLVAPGGRVTGRLERFRAAQSKLYRGAGGFLVIAGIATAVVAAFEPGVAMMVAVASVAVAFLAVALTAFRASRKSPE